MDGAVGDCEGCIITVEHGDGEAVSNSAGCDGAGVDVIEENVRKGCVFFIGIEVCEVDASSCEGCIGWGEDREGTVCLEGGDEVGVGEGGHEAVMDASRLCIGWYILCLVRRHIERCD